MKYEPHNVLSALECGLQGGFVFISVGLNAGIKAVPTNACGSQGSVVAVALLMCWKRRFEEFFAVECF